MQAKVITTLSRNSLVPENYQNELMNIRSADTQHRFRVGQISNILYEKHSLVDRSVTKEQVRRAVALYAGKSVRTIRHYESVADFFSPKTIQKYDVLPFDAFVIAMRYPRWQAILDYAQTELCSMDWLEVWAQRNGFESKEAKLISTETGAKLATPASLISESSQLPVQASDTKFSIPVAQQIIFSDYQDLLDKLRWTLGSFLKYRGVEQSDVQELDRYLSGIEKIIQKCDKGICDGN